MNHLKRLFLKEGPPMTTEHQLDSAEGKELLMPANAMWWCFTLLPDNVQIMVLAPSFLSR